MRLIYYTIFFGNVKKKTAQKTKKIVKKVDKFWNLEYNSERRKQAVGESGLQPGSCRRQRRRTHMKKQKVSDAVIHRLPRYYRYLDELHNKGVVRISSNSLGQKMDITASQIRQDLSCFGEFGQQGYGYNVAELRREIGHILGLDKHDKMILIGAGNLGRAITVHIDFAKYGYELAGIFDSNISLENIEISGIKIMHTNRLADFCAENCPTMAVLCIPKSGAREMVETLMGLGVKAFWNFSHYDIHYDHPEVAVENVHLTDSLMTLSYAARNQQEHSGEATEEQ